MLCSVVWLRMPAMCCHLLRWEWAHRHTSLAFYRLLHCSGRNLHIFFRHALVGYGLLRRLCNMCSISLVYLLERGIRQANSQLAQVFLVLKNIACVTLTFVCFAFSSKSQAAPICGSTPSQAVGSLYIGSCYNVSVGDTPVK